VNALAFPALGLLILTMLLAYSRGALLAAGLGAVFWFACVPLRLRGFAVLAVAAAGAGLVAAWAFAQPGLTEDKIDVSLRATGGHELAVALVAMLAALLVAGFAVGFAAARWPLPAPRRRRAGILILSGLALVPLIVVAALALSNRGLSGSVSHGWNQLTNPHARTPPNEPGRLTAVGSVRARYWNEALKIFKARPVLGSGAGGYATARPQFRQDTLDVRHAHGYVVQTLADLGLVGLAVSVAALAAWLVAAIRATGLHGAARREPYGSERIGLLTLFAVVIVFGVHSFVDWTWFIPGTIVPALLCAGWIAGRGPVLAGSAGSPTWSQRAELRASDPRLAAAVAIGVVAFAAAWATYQPLRAVHAGDGALADLEAGHVARARQAALHAHSINPVSIDPLFDLAAIESESGHPAAARAALEQAVALQPSNAEPWLRLAEFDYDAGSVQAALADLGPALHLDPRSPVGEQLFLEINRKVGGTATP
jgi:O-antigen ligase